jgi:hypothetical protein
MMGQDCERILSTINSLENTVSTAIMKVAKSAATVIKVKANHTHADEGKGKASVEEFVEKEGDTDVSEFTSSISSALSGFLPDIEKMGSLESGLYTSSSSFNNSVGSPWTEIHNLESAIGVVTGTSGNLVGNKTELIAALNIVLTRAVDAKWAIITYADYLQRGYDNKYNDNNPSITFKKNYKNDELDVKQTIGVKNQDNINNVHIKKNNYDPW